MKDKKAGTIGSLIFLVALGTYNFCVFLLVSDYTSVFWSAYIFTTIAFLAQAVVALIFCKSNADAKFLSLPVFVIGIVYFTMQFMISTICMIAPVSITFALIAQMLILSAFIAVTLTLTIAKDQMIKTDGNIKKATDCINLLTMEAERLYLSQEDESKKTEIKKLYEAIRYSDPISSTEEIRAIDQQITMAFQILRDKLSSETADDLKREIKPILDLVAKRNLVCRAGK